jgi:hypothetical protein
MEHTNAVQRFYAVQVAENQFFAGFNPELGKAEIVDSPFKAKLFTNKYEIKLRPAETLVELTVELNLQNTELSNPFRPKRRTVKPA